MHRTPDAEPLRRSVVVLVAALAAATFLQWTGSSSVLPFLPLYLSRRGESDPVVGVVVAAFFVGSFLAQYLGGRLADRVGYRPVLVLGLLGYAVASAGFVLSVDGLGYAALRAVQGAGAGTAQVAALAMVARAVPARMRGRAFSFVIGAELTGAATGPLLGAAVGLEQMTTLFLVAAGAAVLAAGPVLAVRTPELAPEDAVTPGGGSGLAWRGPAGRTLLGVLVAAAVGGLLTGVYESCWTLLLDHRGASQGQIAASWTLFAIPFVIASPVAGWLADHRDRRVLVVVASLVSVGFALAYGVVSSPAWLVGLGAFEAMGVAVALPAAQSLLADAAPARASGRAQGLFASVNTAAVALAALTAGGLFAVAAWVPFVVGGVLGALGTASLPVLWRRTPGRVPAVAEAPAAHAVR